MSDLNPFRISWNRHNRTQWDGMLAACKRPSLTQTSTYALAMHETQGLRADLGVIRFDKKPIGMIVSHGKPSFGTPGSQTIYRGPLWVHDEIPGEMQKLALGLLRQRYRLRRARPVTFHPELDDTPAHRAQMSEAGVPADRRGLSHHLARPLFFARRSARRTAPELAQRAGAGRTRRAHRDR